MDGWNQNRTYWFKWEAIMFGEKNTLHSSLRILSHLWNMVVDRGIMPIETKGARAPSDFWAKWILNAASKRQKIAESYFSIWYNHTGVIRSFSASNHQPLNSNLSSLAVAEPETDAFLQGCIITNHTQFCWSYECNDQSEAFRWVTAETRCFVQGARWLTEFFLKCVRCK